MNRYENQDEKPYDLDCWVEFVEKGQWFMVWEWNWIPLFTWRPEFILQWPKERLTTQHWLTALLGMPELAEHCDFTTLDYVNNIHIDTYSEFWHTLLLNHPQLADRCDWSRIEERDIERILNEHPDLIESLPANLATGEMWRDALLCDGRFAEMCQWEKLSEWNWHDVLATHPEFFKHYVPGEDTDWAKLSKLGLDIDKCCPVESLSGRRLVDLLVARPDLTGRCEWANLSPYDWSMLLQDCPEFADRCDFGKFSGGDWANLLPFRPEFAERCDWNVLSGTDWEVVLSSQPQFADKCDWRKLDVGNWLRLMVLQPQLGDYCELWEEFDEYNWHAVLKYHGDHAWRCPKQLRKRIDRRDWFWDAADAWHSAHGGE